MMPASVKTTFVNGVNPFKSIRVIDRKKTTEQRVVEVIKNCGIDSSRAIAERTGIDRTTVIICLKQLTSAGVLALVQQPKKRNLGNKYIVCEEVAA